MRLWSVHPKYLDSKGLVALWREALLARAVLRGKTQGYRSHPQLERFRSHKSPVSAINSYLLGIYSESVARGYSFQRTKIGPVRVNAAISVTSGQLGYEWQHLLQKLSVRSPQLYRRWQTVLVPECHPLFLVCPGAIESWERQQGGI